jgi:hypothetical protein
MKSPSAEVCQKESSPPSGDLRYTLPSGVVRRGNQPLGTGSTLPTDPLRGPRGHGAQQADIAFLHQIQQRHATIGIAFGHADDQTQVRLRQADLGHFAGVHFLLQLATRTGVVSAQNESHNLPQKLALEQVQQSQDRFAAGVTNNVEVVQAQQQLATASENYISSLQAHTAAKLASYCVHDVSFALGCLNAWLKATRPKSYG